MDIYPVELDIWLKWPGYMPHETMHHETWIYVLALVLMRPGCMDSPGVLVLVRPGYISRWGGYISSWAGYMTQRHETRIYRAVWVLVRHWCISRWPGYMPQMTWIYDSRDQDICHMRLGYICLMRPGYMYWLESSWDLDICIGLSLHETSIFAWVRMRPGYMDSLGLNETRIYVIFLRVY